MSAGVAEWACRLHHAAHGSVGGWENSKCWGEAREAPPEPGPGHRSPASAGKVRVSIST